MNTIMKRTLRRTLSIILTIAMLIPYMGAWAGESPEIGGEPIIENTEVVTTEGVGDPVIPDAGGDPVIPDAGGDPVVPDAGGDPVVPDAGGDPVVPDAGGAPELLPADDDSGSDLSPITLSLSQAGLSLAVGESAALSAALSDGSAAALVWSSADESIALVANGTVTAVAPGAVVITVAAEGVEPVSCTVIVAAPEETEEAPAFEKGYALSSGGKLTVYSDKRTRDELIAVSDDAVIYVLSRQAVGEKEVFEIAAAVEAEQLTEDEKAAGLANDAGFIYGYVPVNEAAALTEEQIEKYLDDKGAEYVSLPQDRSIELIPVRVTVLVKEEAPEEPSVDGLETTDLPEGTDPVVEDPETEVLDGEEIAAAISYGKAAQYPLVVYADTELAVAIGSIEESGIFYVLPAEEGTDVYAIALYTGEALITGYVSADMIELLNADEIAAYIAGAQENWLSLPSNPEVLLVPVAFAAVELPITTYTVQTAPLWSGRLPGVGGVSSLLGLANAEGGSFGAALANGIAAFEAELDVSSYGITNEDITAALQAYVDATPTSFYLTGDFEVDATEQAVKVIRPQYKYDAQTAAAHESAIDGFVAKLVAGAANGSDALQKAFWLRNTLGWEMNYSGSGAVSPEDGVAAGAGSSAVYAYLYQQAATQLGIGNAIVRGVDRAWNMIQLDGSWYHVDVAAFVQLDRRDYSSYMAASDQAMRLGVFGRNGWLAPYKADDTRYDGFDFISLFPRGEDQVDLLRDGKFVSVPPEVKSALPLATLTIEQVLMAGFDAELLDIPTASFGLNMDQIKKAFQNVLNKNPEYFYVSGRFEYSHNYGQSTVLYFHPQYIFTGQDRINRVSAFKSAASRIINTIPGGASVVQKALMVNDYFATHFEYSYGEDIFRPDELFEKKKGVCQAYTLAFQYVMNRLGIPCDFVISDRVKHIWNMIQVDGQWYHVDVTWSEHGYQDNRRAIPHYAGHTNFLLSDAAHRAEGHYDWVANYSATSTKYDNYFWRNIENAFAPLGGSFYFVGWQYPQMQLCRWDGGSSYSVVYSYTDSWSWGAGVYPMSSLIAANGKLIYNTSSEIYAINPNGTGNTLLYKPELGGKQIVGVYLPEMPSYVTSSVGYTAAIYDARTERIISASLQSPLGQFIERLYNNVLNRASEEAGFTYFLNTLLSGAQGGAQVAATFFDSPEFKNAKHSNEAFLTILYQTCMNRAPDAEGLAFWLAHLKAGATRMAVLNSFLGHPEFRGICDGFGIEFGALYVPNASDESILATQFVYRLYKVTLDREPEQSGLNYHCNELLHVGTTAAQTVRNFIFSPEFQNKNYNDATYIYYIYRAVFGRDPDAQGLAHFVEVLKSESRTAILERFIRSEEFQVMIKDYGLK